MSEAKILRTLRNQAWERAKGELQAVMQTFWGSDTNRDGQYKELSKAIDNFITDVESRGLQE